MRHNDPLTPTPQSAANASALSTLAPAGAPSPTGADNADFGPDFGIVFQAIAHNLRTILAVTLAGALAAFFLIRSMTPVFTAGALIIIDTRTSLLDDAPLISGLPIADAYIENEIELIRSDAIVHKVVERAGLFDDPEFARGETPSGIARMARNQAEGGDATDAQAMLASVALMQVSEKIRRRLDVKRRGLSHAVEISFKSRSQTKARDIANAFAEAYLEDQLATKRAASAQATDWLREELARLAGETQRAEKAVEDYRARNTLIGEGDNGSSAQQLRSLTGELAAARVRLSELQVTLDQLERLRAESGSAVLLPAIAARPVIAGLRLELSAADRELAEIRSRYNAENIDALPVFQEAAARRAALEASLEAEVDSAVKGVKADAAAARALMASLEAELDALKDDNARLNAAGLGLAELERTAEAKRQLYETLLAEYNKADNIAAAQTSNARIVSPAQIPLTPSAPRKKAVFAAAAIFSAAAGFFLAFVREFVRRGIRSAEEFSALTGAALDAMVPRPPKGGDAVRAAMGDKALRRNDAYRQAVAKLVRPPTDQRDVDHGVGGGRGRVIVVAAPSPRESAAPLAAAFARSMALRDEKTLLVDLDLARPQILPQAFSRHRGADLGDVFAGRAGWRKALARRRKFGPRLAVLGVRTRTDDSGAAAQDQLDALVGEWREAFAAVIIAAPSMTSSPAMGGVAKAADAVVLPARWERTDRRAILTSLKACAEIGVAPVTVLCDVPPRVYAYHQGEALWRIAVGPALAEAA